MNADPIDCAVLHMPAASPAAGIYCCWEGSDGARSEMSAAAAPGIAGVSGASALLINDIWYYDWGCSRLNGDGHTAKSGGRVEADVYDGRAVYEVAKSFQQKIAGWMRQHAHGCSQGLRAESGY